MWAGVGKASGLGAGPGASASRSPALESESPTPSDGSVLVSKGQLVPEAVSTHLRFPGWDPSSRNRGLVSQEWMCPH